MPAPPCDELRVVRYADRWGFAARQWQQAIRAVDWDRRDAEPAVRRLKIRADGDCTVWRTHLTLDGQPREVVLKTAELPTLIKQAQSWLGLSKSFRQWRGAELLNAHGIHAARGLAILRGRRDEHLLEMLVVEPLDGPTVLQLLTADDLGVRQQHALARAVGSLFAELIKAGIRVRDPKPSNIIVTGWKDGTPALALVDTVDVVRAEMEPLAITKAYFEPAGLGCTPRRTLLYRALRAMCDAGPAQTQPGSIPPRQRVRALWDWASAEMARHGDPTPTDNPLATD